MVMDKSRDTGVDARRQRQIEEPVRVAGRDKLLNLIVQRLEVFRPVICTLDIRVDLEELIDL